MRLLSLQLVPVVLVCLSWCSPRMLADEVQVVVGGLLSSEGGDWKPETSPLTAPFGVAFDRAKTMWIVELEGGASASPRGWRATAACWW